MNFESVKPPNRNDRFQVNLSFLFSKCCIIILYYIIFEMIDFQYHFSIQSLKFKTRTIPFSSTNGNLHGTKDSFGTKSTGVETVPGVLRDNV